MSLTAGEPRDRRDRRDRRDLLATLAIVLGLAALLGGSRLARRLGPHPTPEQCSAMLDRYAEQRARAALPDGAESPPPRRPAEPHPPAEIARCARELTPRELECAMRSGYADELERCLPP
ncbi:MAG: hypothetical protein U0359_39535 [Byssovorax sp.]